MGEEKSEQFDTNVKPGVLILVEPDDIRRWFCTMWFDFTMATMRRLRVGDLVAVQNFNTKDKSLYYSILRLTSVQPKHYALSGDDLKAYPGNIEEAARNIMPDFMEQESESSEDTTKIYCEAVPIDMQVLDNGAPFSTENMSKDESVPITGSDVHVISETLTQMIYNGNMKLSDAGVVRAGKLIKSKDVNIFIGSEDFMKLHFGLFGFTGAGKSNLVSTIVRSILSKHESKRKFIIFDLMDEYTGLLIDKLLDDNVNGYMVSLGEAYLPQSVRNYFATKDPNLLDKAAEDFVAEMLLPKHLRPFKDNYKPFVKQLLERNKIRVVLLAATRTVEDFVREIWPDVFDEYIVGPTKNELEITIGEIRDQHAEEVLTKDLAGQLMTWLEGKKKDKGASRASTVNDRIQLVINKLKEIRDAKEVKLSPDVKYSIDDIIAEVNSDKKSSLLIFTSNDPNVMRRYAKKIGQYVYDERTKRAIISPIASFIFDEADEFIPGQPKGSQSESKEIVETLARRGRKFGLGVGIATQRITYLDTNIMGQPHTYFISKLPRESDRERIAEAFGLSTNDMKQTLQFKKGEWLLISHDATGLEGVPIPIQTDNAESEIKKFLGVKD